MIARQMAQLAVLVEDPLASTQEKCGRPALAEGHGSTFDMRRPVLVSRSSRGLQANLSPDAECIVELSG